MLEQTYTNHTYTTLYYYYHRTGTQRYTTLGALISP